MNTYGRNMHQAATLFRRTGLNAYGEPSFDAGTPIKCRWQVVHELSLDAQGEEFVSQAIVYPSVQVVVGDRLAKGAAAVLADAKEVRAANESPRLDGRMVIFKAVL